MLLIIINLVCLWGWGIKLLLPCMVIHHSTIIHNRVHSTKTRSNLENYLLNLGLIKNQLCHYLISSKAQYTNIETT